MDKDKINSIDAASLSAVELWEVLYGKELKTKKSILEYIELTRILKKQNVDPEKVQETYNFVYNSINKMSKDVKPNTIMYLQNQLKGVLGKLVYDKEPKEESAFIEFFREAYPSGERRKDFTWVLMDINNINEEQIWHTLTYINRECLNNGLDLIDEEKQDIIDVIQILIDRKNVDYINKVRSLQKLNEVLGIKIISKKNEYKIVHKA